MDARRSTAWIAVVLGLTCSAALAQEATKGEIHGVVKDEAGGMLPGVVVTAVHLDTGSARTTTTGESGLYRLPALPLGAYTVTAELQGFAVTTREGITLGLGQALAIDFELKLASVSESITVTGEAPLLDTTKAEVAGALAPSQIAGLPLMGRNWLELGFLMPGVTSTVIHPRGVASGRGDVLGQNIIIDGVDAREECCNRQVGTHSQEAIAEFKLISNNYSAEYGRSISYVLTAVTKSGTNAIHGTGFYLMRDESLDKPDFFTKVSEPLKYYQAGGSIGGPIRKDRMFFFGAVERQFDERTGFSSTRFPSLDSYKVPLRAWQNYALGKTDWQFKGTQHLSAKYYFWYQDDLNGSVVSSRGVEGRQTPWATTDRTMRNQGVAINHTWAGKNQLNEFTFGYTWLDWYWTGKSGIPVPGGVRNPEYRIPRLEAPSFAMGWHTAVPQDPAYEYKWEFKNNFTRFFNWHGDHGLKTGVNVILSGVTASAFYTQRGQLNFVRDPIDPFDFNSYPEPTRFQMRQGRPTAPCPDGISERGRREFDLSGSCAWYLSEPNPIYAGFVQDDWRVSPRLTLNLGARYEIETGALIPDYIERFKPQLDPQLPHPDKSDRNNLGPRAGASYDLRGDGKTIIRGGAGIYFGSVNFNRTANKLLSDGWMTIIVDQAFPTRQPCFQGHTLEEAITQNPKLLLPGCGSLSFDELYALAPKAITTFDPDYQVDRAIQSTIGFAHQLMEDLAIEADFVYNRTGPDKAASDVNLFFDPATGGPKDPRIFGRPDPRFTSITTQASWGRSVYKALQVRVNKRMRHNYQFQANYTLATSSRDNLGFGPSPTPDNPFDRNEWGPAEGSATHRLSVNGVIDLPLGLQVGGVLLAYSGIHYDNRVAGDFWNLGRATSRTYREADGTLVTLERNSNVGSPFAKLDLRVTKWFKLGGDRQVALVAELFNVLNRANYGSYGTTLGSRTYRQPLRNPSNQFAPRQTQIGVRVAF